MSTTVHARLNRRKRKRNVPALWETTLGTVISNLSEQHTDDFVRMVLLDGDMRKRFTEVLLRRAEHIPDLGDSDLVEFVMLPVYQNADDDDYSAEHSLNYCSVGQLPYWLKAALKTQFKDRASASASVSGMPGEGDISRDGRLEIKLSENDPESLQPLTNAYIGHLEQLIVQEGIPNKEDVGYPHDDDAADIFDVAPGVQPDTCLWDAWELSVNECEDQLREVFVDNIEGLYVMACDGHPVSGDCFPLSKAMQETGNAQVSTVWVRKPRVRLVIRPAGN